MKPSFKIWVFVVLMVPLLFTRVNAYHDWGDDFAQYLLQAQWLGGIIDMLPVSDILSHGPPVKGLLFSLLLAPLAYIPVPLILSGKILITLFLGLMGVLLFYRIKPLMTPFPAMMIALAFVWHPAMLNLKDQVLPDFIFTVVIFVAILLWDRNQRGDRRLALLLASLSFGLKSAGLVLIATMAILMVLQRTPKRPGIRLWIALLLPAFLIAVLETVLGGQQPSAFWYSSASIHQFGSLHLIEHAENYRRALLMLLETESPLQVNQLIPWLIIPAIFAGFLIELRSRNSIALLFLPLYLLMLFLYPYDRDPVRFLIPILPWMLYYACLFYSRIFSFAGINYRWIVLSCFTLILSLPFFNTIRLDLNKQVVYAPQSFYSVMVLDYLRFEIPKGLVVADIHPWSLAWFSGVRTVHATSAYKADLMLIRTSNMQFHFFPGKTGAETMFSNQEFKVLKLNNK